VEVENGRRGEEEAEKKKNKSDLIQQVQLSVGGVPGVVVWFGWQLAFL